MKTLLCLKSLMQRLKNQKKDIFGKYQDKDYGINDGGDTDLYTDDDDEDQHYSRKKSQFDPWHLLKRHF